MEPDQRQPDLKRPARDPGGASRREAARYDESAFGAGGHKGYAAGGASERGTGESVLPGRRCDGPAHQAGQALGREYAMADDCGRCGRREEYECLPGDGSRNKYGFLYADGTTSGGGGDAAGADRGRRILWVQPGTCSMSAGVAGEPGAANGGDAGGVNAHRGSSRTRRRTDRGLLAVHPEFTLRICPAGEKLFCMEVCPTLRERQVFAPAIFFTTNGVCE